MQFQQKFRHNKTQLLIFNDVFGCMKQCRTSFKELVSAEEANCLNTCGFNTAFIRDVAIADMMENNKGII